MSSVTLFIPLSNFIYSQNYILLPSFLLSCILKCHFQLSKWQLIHIDLNMLSCPCPVHPKSPFFLVSPAPGDELNRPPEALGGRKEGRKEGKEVGQVSG
jgi:hypothetical protein